MNLVVELPEEAQFVLPHDPGEDKMVEGGKSFLQFEADSSQGNTVGENHVSDNIPGIERGRLCYTTAGLLTSSSSWLCRRVS